MGNRNTRAVRAAVASPSGNAEDSVEQLIREFTGQVESPSRTPKEWESAARAVIDTLLSAPSWPGVKGSPKLLLDEIVERVLAPGAEIRRKAIVEALLSNLEKRQELNDRVFLLRELAEVGGGESVPLLGRLLEDKELVLREYALRALQANPSHEAGRTLLVALAEADTPGWRLAIVNALGSRRETSAVSKLKERLHAEEDEKVSSAMRMALGNIGRSDAVAGPAWQRDSVAQAGLADATRARLLAADRQLDDGNAREANELYEKVHAQTKEPLFRLAALRGVVRSSPDRAVPLLLDLLKKENGGLHPHAARLLLELRSEQAVQAMRAALPDLPAAVRKLVEEALGERRGE